MFIDLEPQLEKAEYYNLKNFEMALPNSSKVAKQFVFTKYNPKIGKEEYSGKNITGYLHKITIGEPKQVKNFNIQNLFLDFHGFSNGKLGRAVVVLSKKGQIFELIVSKLANLDDFSWVTIKCGVFKDSTDKWRQTIVIKDKERKPIQKRINFRYKDSAYPQPQNLIEIPEYKVVRDENGDPILSADGKTQPDPIWLDKKNKIYSKALDDLIKKHKEWEAKNPFKEEMQPDIDSSYLNTQIQTKQRQDIVKQIDNIPTIQVENEYMPEQEVIMPF